MPRKEWAYRRTDDDCAIREAFVNSRLKDFPPLRNKWPAVKGKHRRVAVGARGGQFPLEPSNGTRAIETKEPARVSTQKPHESEEKHGR